MPTLDLILERPLVWGLFLAYMALTSWLAWLGHKKNTDLTSFAVGQGDMNPAVVGITLAASIASTATFVINPGFVYVHGLAAFMHFGVAAGLGLTIGLLALSIGFRRIGQKTLALTLPQWIGQRYGSRAMTTFFAAANLLSLTFVVLIVASLAIVMQATLGLGNAASVVLIIGFVFSYVFVGGTYAHAYTNTLQGAIMAVVAAIIVASGLHHFAGGLGPVADKLSAINPALVEAINTESNLFGSFFSIYVSGFLIGFALVSQPHIMIKALYVKEERHVWQYLGVCLGVSLFFTALLLVGFYAHLSGIPAERFLNPATGAFRQDLVMTVYLAETFSPVMLAFISVALMSAGMSTLDGILVALSSIAANDLFLGLTEKNVLSNRTEAERLRIAHRAGQIILVTMGVVTGIIAMDPPKLLGLFGQVGVYGIVAASCAPILFGIVFKQARGSFMFASALTGLLVHLGLYGWGMWASSEGVNLNDTVAGLGPLGAMFDGSMAQLGFANPAVTATYGLIASALVALVALGLQGRGEGVDGEPA